MAGSISTSAADGGRFAPRKLPKQQRARKSVDFIKQATLQLARERGVSGFTTDDVAARAGVNIASIYQYFPNREAILFAIYQDASKDLLDEMQQLNVQIFDMPLLDAARCAMRHLLALYERREFELLHLTADIPELERAVRPVSFNSLHEGTMNGFIRHRRVQPSARELDRLSFFVWRIGLSCIRDYLLQKPKGLSRRQFIEDLAWIIAAYLQHR